MTSNLDETLSATQSRLHDIGVSDALAREILSFRLLVERIGESDNNGWWESIVLTETGRDRLDEVTPKTATKGRIDLAQRVGKKAEQDRLDDDSISLFYLGPTVEAQISAELDDLSEPTAFDELEEMSNTVTSTGWTEGLVENPGLGLEVGQARVSVGQDQLDEQQLKSRTRMRDVARGCFIGYGQSTQDALRVPTVELEL